MVVISISSKGQVTLPVKLRRQAGLELKDRILIEVQEGQLIIRKAENIMGLKGFLGKGMGSSIGDTHFPFLFRKGGCPLSSFSTKYACSMR